ncbi:MAG: hypothetical protein KDD33_09355 [Bdellovibrionales bacterium]|nr:hypothetical protein [Bdellovibrionales bacterium]
MNRIVYIFAFLLLTHCQMIPLSRSPEGLAILQGPTNQSETQLVVLALKNEKYTHLLKEKSSGKVIKAVSEQKVERSHSPWAVYTVQYKELKVGETYQLSWSKKNGEILDERELTTLDPKKNQWTLGLVSCMADKVEGQKAQWLDLASNNPDAIFMIGDNVYIDWGIKSKMLSMTTQEIWNRHVETRNTLEVFRLKKLIPIYSTWDDHDYGSGDGDLSFHLKDESKEIFRQFFPAHRIRGLEMGRGVGFSVELFGQQFLFLDDRSFRTPKHLKSTQSHFGDSQSTWLLQKVQGFSGRTWLMSGDQFFGGYHPFESFQGDHPQDFKNFLFSLKKIKNPVLFVSGDRHLSEVMAIPKKILGYPTYEITSSGIHSTVHPGSFEKNPNPYMVKGADGIINYMVIKGISQGKRTHLEIFDFGPNRKLLFQHEIAL